MEAPARPRYRKRKLVAKTFAWGLAVALCLATGLIVLWERGNLQPWLKARIVELYLRKVQPHLPFEIESADVDTGWRDLLGGKVNHLSATLHWGKWHIPLSGPIEISRTGERKEDYLIRFAPEVSIEPAGSSLEDLKGAFGNRESIHVAAARSGAPHEHHHASGSSTTLQLDLRLVVSREFTQLRQIDLQATPSDEGPEFKWPLFGIAVQSPRISASWNGTRAWAEARIAGGHWQRAGTELSAGALEFHAEAPLALKPSFKVGPEIVFAWKGEDAEALLGDTYLALPLSRLPGEGSIALEPSASGKTLPARAQLTLGAPGDSQLSASLEAERDAQGALRRVRLGWKLAPLDIAALIRGALAAAGATGGPLQNARFLRELDVRSGRLRAEGSASLPVPLSSFRVDHPSDMIDARVRLEEVDARLARLALGVDGLDLDLPVSTRRPGTGSLAVGTLLYRHFRAHLPETELGLSLRKEKSGAKTTHFDFHLGNGDAIPLAIEGLGLKLKRLWGILATGDDDEAGFHYELETGLSLPPTPLSGLLNPACVPAHVPPAQVSIDMPKIDLAPGTVDPTGEIRADLFGGSVTASEIGLFDLGSGYPEIDFDAEAKDLRLDQMGEYFNFGKMDGLLEASANDVTLQGRLPTHYDFTVWIKPLSYRLVDWSPEAFQNFLLVFIKVPLPDHLPAKGLIHSTFFGTISHWLGGWDIWHAGISLFADQGSVLVETNEPPSVYEHWKKHYIMVGPRIKIPLNASTYPVVLDARLIEQYAIGTAKQLGELHESRQQAAPPQPQPQARPGKPDTRTAQKEKPDENPSACLSPDF